MIVRILGEGQFEVLEEHQAALDALDATLVKSVEAEDAAAFSVALLALAAEVRKVGIPLADDAFTPSVLIVPFADSSLAETKRLLAEAAPSDQ